MHTLYSCNFYRYFADSFLKLILIFSYDFFLEVLCYKFKKIKMADCLIENLQVLTFQQRQNIN